MKKEKDNDVTSQQQPSTPVVSLTASSGNSVEQLLQPRFKIIASWPRSGFPVGLVFTGNVLTDLQKSVIECEQYPHIFQRLEWWEERKIDELPEFVHETGGGIKKALYAHDGIFIRLQTEDGGNWAVIRDVMCFFYPATKEEYDRFMLNKVQNVQECDARDDASNSTDGSQKNNKIKNLL